ncbi:MAG: hypothetical protein ABR968_09905 [Bacteroidales bacterium]
MPYERAIIPRDINRFNEYINQTNDYLILGSPTNAVRFGWSSQNLLDWQGFRNEWNPLFFKYSDRKGSYTTVIKTSLEAIIANAVIYDWDNKLTLKIKATVGLNSEDCSTFRIPLFYSMPLTSKPSVAKSGDKHKTSIMYEAVYPKINPAAGGFVEIACHLESEGSGRAHKPEGFDLVEYKVAVFYSGTADVPAHAEDARLSLAYSSKAGFVLNTTVFKSNLPVLAADAMPPAKMAVFFFRWAKSKHPLLDGPWSGPYTTPLL